MGIFGYSYLAYSHEENKHARATSIEYEAAKYIDTHTKESYYVMCDFNFRYAGIAVAGFNNPDAFFSAPRSSIWDYYYNNVNWNPIDWHGSNLPLPSRLQSY